MNAFRLEAGRCGEPAQDQEGARPCQRPAAGVEEELRAVARVEKRTTARQVAAQRFDGGSADRHDALLAPFPERPNDARVEIHVAFREADRFTDAQAASVEQLDERAVAMCARRRSRSRLDQPFGLGRRQRARKLASAARQVELCCGVVQPLPQQHLVTEERSQGGHAARDRRARETGRAKLRQVGLEILGGRPGDGGAEPVRDRVEIAAVRLDRARRTPRCEQREETLDLGVTRNSGHGRNFASAPRSPAVSGPACG